jgi:hypothetical protein
MAKQSQAWKSHERKIAAVLGGQRIVRQDWGESAPDVHIADFPHFKVDGKYRQKFMHHSLLREIAEKYCRKQTETDAPGDVPILVTRVAGERGAVVSLRVEDFGMLLDVVRGTAPVKCPTCGALSVPRPMVAG